MVIVAFICIFVSICVYIFSLTRREVFSCVRFGKKKILPRTVVKAKIEDFGWTEKNEFFILCKTEDAEEGSVFVEIMVKNHAMLRKIQSHDKNSPIFLIKSNFLKDLLIFELPSRFFNEDYIYSVVQNDNSKIYVLKRTNGTTALVQEVSFFHKVGVFVLAMAFFAAFEIPIFSCFASLVSCFLLMTNIPFKLCKVSKCDCVSIVPSLHLCENTQCSTFQSSFQHINSQSETTLTQNPLIPDTSTDIEKQLFAIQKEILSKRAAEQSHTEEPPAEKPQPPEEPPAEKPQPPEEPPAEKPQPPEEPPAENPQPPEEPPAGKPQPPEEPPVGKSKPPKEPSAGKSKSKPRTAFVANLQMKGRNSYGSMKSIQNKQNSSKNTTSASETNALLQAINESTE